MTSKILLFTLCLCLHLFSSSLHLICHGYLNILSFFSTLIHWCLFLLLLSMCSTSLLCSWVEGRLTWESNEARYTSTACCLVTADAPLNPSTTNQRYYVINSVNRAGQWLQVQYCFHLTFFEFKWESHPFCCQDCQCMTNGLDTINHFHLSIYSKEGKATHTHGRKQGTNLWQFSHNNLQISYHILPLVLETSIFCFSVVIDK